MMQTVREPDAQEVDMVELSRVLVVVTPGEHVPSTNAPCESFSKLWRTHP